jgi:hypothetical protein
MNVQFPLQFFGCLNGRQVGLHIAINRMLRLQNLLQCHQNNLPFGDRIRQAGRRVPTKSLNGIAAVCHMTYALCVPGNF